MKHLNKPVVIIAGGTGGIGNIVCNTMAKAGYQVVCVSRGITKPEFPFVEGVCLKKCDVTSLQQCDKLVLETIKEYDRVDCLIYAAIGYFYGSPEEHSEDAMNEVFQGNIFGAHYLSSACVKHFMKEQKTGNICFIGSTAGEQILHNRAAYCSSKAALKVLMKALAVDWAKYNIRVNMVTTSYVATALEMNGAESQEWGHTLSDIMKRTPMKRPAYPEEIAEAIKWIVSTSPQYLTGSDILVDGGWTAWSAFGELDENA